jgi:hypothetical protein
LAVKCEENKKIMQEHIALEQERAKTKVYDDQFRTNPPLFAPHPQTTPTAPTGGGGGGVKSGTTTHSGNADNGRSGGGITGLVRGALNDAQNAVTGNIRISHDFYEIRDGVLWYSKRKVSPPSFLSSLVGRWKKK